jgi:hypothetical protein
MGGGVFLSIRKTEKFSPSAPLFRFSGKDTAKLPILCDTENNFDTYQ